MVDPGIQAERNLVTNGAFNNGLTGWTKGPVNPAYVTTKPEEYNGPIRIMEALDGSSAFQDIPVPKTASADARYVINFLCEMDHDKEGMLELCISETAETQKIPLRVGAGRDRNADRECEAKGQPRVFKPIEYTVNVTLPLLDTHKLRVAAISPPNEPGDYFSSLRITNINLRLHLPAAKLRALKLDEQFLPLNRALPLCLGAIGSAAHRFMCVHAADDSWQGTRASLNIEVNLQGAIVVDPDWGKDKPLADFWSCSCPDIDGVPPHLFNLQLSSEFNAPAHEIQVSLDHHRVKFLELKGGAHFVVLEYDQSARVGVCVGSHYTGNALEGRVVSWTVEGTSVSAIVLTDREGWAWFDYKPVAAGDVRIVASVESLYYASGVVVQDFEIKVLATDPWKDVRTIVADEERPWEQKGYPNRGAIYQLLILLPEVLLGTHLMLHSIGDSLEQLGVVVSPPLGDAVPVGADGKVEYQLASEDKLDGQFALQLISSHLLVQSPEKPMSLARNVVKPGEVREPDRTCVVDENESARMWVQVLHETALGDGDPVERALVFWKDPDGTVTRSFTGSGGWSSHRYQPLAAGEHSVIATIKAHEEAEPSEKNFVVKAIATSPWKQHVQVFLDGSPVDLKTLGLICWHDQTHTLKVVPVSGSAWIRTKSISLDWQEADPRIGLNMSNPGVPFLLTPEGLSWNLTPSADARISSLFGFRLKADGVADDRELPGRFINPDLTQELSIRFDRGSAALNGQTLYPCLGATHHFNVWLNALSPLVGLSAALEWSGTPADEFDATMLPPLPGFQSMGADGSSWEFDFLTSLVTGEFALTLSLPQLAYVATATPMLLGHNAVSFNYVLESPVDPVVDLDPVWTWMNVISRFTKMPVAGVPVTWRTTDTPVVVNTDAEGNSGFGFVPANADIHTVRSSLFSPYDNYAEAKSTKIQPLTIDPWLQAKISLDGQPQQVWGSSTGFPRRKGVHSVVAFLPKVLEGQVVRLGQTGTAPSELGNRYEPELGAAQVVTNGLVRFSLRAGDVKDGSFALRLSAERLARLSPANAMSQGAGSQVLKISTVSQIRSELLWGDYFEAFIQVVSSISAQPMGEVLVTFSHSDLGDMQTVTDYYGRATLRFVPITPGASHVIAKVGDTLHSVSVAMNFILAEPRQIVELYEPIGSRQPPDESQAHAKAKVTSASTGLPLADVAVAWEFAGRIMNSVTNAEGIADLTFTYSNEGDGVLSATVKGGIGGWDMAVLAYTGEVPVIESMTTPSTTIAVGEQASAVIKVVDRRNGQVMRGVRVNSVFAGNTLPATHTQADGTAVVLFTPTEPGERVLTASVGFGSKKSQEYTVVPLELTELKLSVFEVEAGSNFTAQARVFPAIAGVKVLMRSTGEMDLSSRTDSEGLSLALVFKAKRPADDHFATVSARINAGQDGEMTLAKKVWVKDPAADNLAFWIGNTPVLLPDLNYPLKPNTDMEVSVSVAEENYDKEYAIFCDQSTISTDPLLGVFRSYSGLRMRWTISSQAPTGTRIALVAADRDGSVVGRLILLVKA
ncbi:hypothetical protein [Pseudomonas moraviensis]|uniref:Uncharacterized protein n=1 Tax=Pseudomonas moraviensis TaxID=321662 RepID=A0A7Y9VX70_9PSED|nr:hypothetical protein [Pseudomonas moraviensis]NYH10254.1 hypothetical protein [Pseudomonas moraviensis]